MYEHRQKWVKLIEAYKEIPCLWDRTQKDYTNHAVRNQHYEKLLDVYRKIDSKGTLMDLKKAIESLRSKYRKERQKILISQKNGKEYIPTLWFYKYLTFLTVETRKLSDDAPKFCFDRYNNQIFLGQIPAVRKKTGTLDGYDTSMSENEKGQVITVEAESSDGEDNTENIQPPSPKKRIRDLLQNQKNFVATASRILTNEEEDWEVLGKAIGLQVYNLEPKQKAIANKLISDIIYYASLEKLTGDAFVHVESGASESILDQDEIMYAL